MKLPFYLILFILISFSQAKVPKTHFYGIIEKDIKEHQRTLKLSSSLKNKTQLFYRHQLNSLPESFSYCGKYHKNNPYKSKSYCIHQTMNQGECGCCYSMALAQLLQIHYTRLTNQYKVFSTQQIIDCSSNYGCSGGWPAEVLQSLRYVVSEIDYPYELLLLHDKPFNYKGICQKGMKSLLHIDDYVQVTGPITFDEMKVLLIEHGPLIGLIYANDQMREYSGGILHLNCSVDVSINHAIIIVGYGIDKENKDEYIIIRNSWGNSWGEKGYARLSFNNLCGLNGNSKTVSPTLIYVKTSCLFSFIIFSFYIPQYIL